MKRAGAAQEFRIVRHSIFVYENTDYTLHGLWTKILHHRQLGVLGFYPSLHAGFRDWYGFDYGAAVSVDVTLSSNTSGETSNTVGPVSAISGDVDSQECTGGGCDTAGTGDVNADGATNVLDIVSLVNFIISHIN